MVRSLKDHSDAVYGLAFSPDGKTLASCAADRTVKLWDWATGKRKATLSESTAELYAVVFTPDGSRVLAAGVDRSIRMWRVDRRRGAARAVGLRPRRADRPAGRLGRRHDAGLERRGSDGPALGARHADARRRRFPPRPTGCRRWRSARTAAGWRWGVTTGSLALWDHGAGKLGAGAPRAAGSQVGRAPPKLVRNASLNPPSPRGAVRGSRVRVTLTGQGVGRATAIILPEPGLTATIVPAAKPDANRIEVELAIAADARVGLHSHRRDHAAGRARLSDLRRRRPTPRWPSTSRTTGSISSRPNRPRCPRPCSARSTVPATSTSSRSRPRPASSSSSRSWPDRWARNCGRRWLCSIGRGTRWPRRTPGALRSIPS